MELWKYLSIPWHRRLPLVALFSALVIGAALVAARALPQLGEGSLPAGFWMMAGLAALLDLRPFTVAGRRDTMVAFPSVCLIFAILLAYGLGPAILAQTVTLLAAALTVRLGPFRAIWRLGQYIIAYGMAELVLVAGHLHPFPVEDRLTVTNIAVVLVAAAVWFLFQFVTSTLGVWLRDGGSLGTWMNRTLAWESLATGGMLLLSPVLVAATAPLPLLVPLVVLPLYAVFRLGRLPEDVRTLSAVDPITGLANRGELLRVAARQVDKHADLADQGEPASRLGLILFDLDRFQLINGVLGYQLGDRLLREVGQRLRAAAGPEDLVARVGGDEYAVLAPHLTGAADARAVAGRMQAALETPIRLDELPLDLSASIGVAVFPEHGQDIVTLLRHADAALHEAKRRTATVAVYRPEIDQDALRRLSLLADLRAALDAPNGGGLGLYYQPQVALDTGEVVGLEALLRWHHPERGPINPAELIEIAEQTAVMRVLTLRILNEVVEQVAKWYAAGARLRVSVNVSIRDLRTGEVAEQLIRHLRRHGLPVEAVQLEITEGALMADPRRVMATLAALERLRVAVSLDDFGTGYSSLQHLRRLPLSEVKIDRSFVTGMTEDPDDAAIVGMMVELGRAIGLRVVAEGVEDEPTWRRLAALGCHVGQGWFFARPMPPEQVLPWLTRFPPRPAPGFRTRSAAGAVSLPERGPGG